MSIPDYERFICHELGADQLKRLREPMALAFAVEKWYSMLMNEEIVKEYLTKEFVPVFLLPFGGSVL